MKNIFKVALSNINWVAVSLSIIGIVLNANRDTLCWPVWLLSNTCWIAYSLPRKDWAYVLLWIVFGAFNIYGWYQWAQ